MGHDIVAIQEFMARFFSDEELIIFCKEHFPEADADLSPEMGVRKKAGVLVGYCARRGEVPTLVKELEAERPKRFAEWRGKLIGEAQAPARDTGTRGPGRKGYERWREEGADEYQLAAIRSLLQDAFMTGELRRFCQVRPRFLPLLAYFSPNASQEEMIEIVLDYSRTHLLFPELLDGIREVNLRQFERHEARL